MEVEPGFYGNSFEIRCAFCGETILISHGDKVHTVCKDGLPVDRLEQRYACYGCGKEKKECKITSIRIKIPKKLRHFFPPLED